MRKLFLILYLLPCLSLSKAKAVEPYKEYLEKSQNLILQKDRLQATQLLINGLKRERKGSPAYLELKRAIEDTGSLFISDKALQSFEMSLSFKRKDLNQAINKINEALKIESDNILIVTESARLTMLKGDCGAAKQQLQKFYSQNPYNDLILLTMAQVEICLKATDQYFSVRTGLDAKRTKFSVQWQQLELDRLLYEKNLMKAKEELQVLKKLDGNNPQIYFYETKLSEPNSKAVSLYQKSCKNLSAQVFRAYYYDPYLCYKDLALEGGTTNETE